MGWFSSTVLCILFDCCGSSAGALRHSLQDRLSKSSSGKSRDEIYLKLRTSTGQFVIDSPLSLLAYALKFYSCRFCLGG